MENKTDDYSTYRLPNGIRLIFSHSNSEIGYCGLFINAGSRDEMEDELGIAHFIEHTIFKGTKKRKAYHILNRMEVVGGELNAYTTKEKTVVYSAFLKEYFNRALELIADIVFYSTFPTHEINKEKEVVIDEINSYKDSPSEQIYDDFEEHLFPNESIGRQILGSKSSIRSFTSKDIQKFIQNNYHTDEMVISVVGNTSFAKVIKMVERYYSDVPASPRPFSRRQQPISKPFEFQNQQGGHQAHCILGTESMNLFDSRKTTLGLLNNLLGGPGLNARLNLSLRERNGLVYTVESSFVPYTDTGLFYVYFGGDKENLDRGISLVLKEFKLLREKQLGSLQLNKAKKQLIGQIAMGEESNEARMISNGKNMLFFNKVDTLSAVYRRINEVSVNDLLDLSNDLFQEDKLSKLIFL